MTNSLPAPPVSPPRVLMPQVLWPELSDLAQTLQLGFELGPYGPEFSPERSAPVTPEQVAQLHALPDYGALSLSGPDTQTFLQGQLTNDVAALSIGDTQLTGYCTPKGRLLASGWLIRRAEQEYVWIVSSPLVAALAKRLKMFVMRAKVQVQPLLETHFVLGLHRATPALLADVDPAALPLALPEVRFGSGTYLVLLPLAQVAQTWSVLSSQAQICSTQDWRALEIEAGVARITASTSELFVPQMVNFELTGGVNFKKGCYPGQEIVARSQYLGKLKRRMMIASFAGEAQVLPAADVLRDPSANHEAIGQIVMSARVEANTLCLVETGELTSQTQLWTQSVDGKPLELAQRPLPYAIEKIA